MGNISLFVRKVNTGPKVGSGTDIRERELNRALLDILRNLRVRLKNGVRDESPETTMTLSCSKVDTYGVMRNIDPTGKKGDTGIQVEFRAMLEITEATDTTFCPSQDVTDVIARAILEKFPIANQLRLDFSVMPIDVAEMSSIIIGSKFVIGGAYTQLV